MTESAAVAATASFVPAQQVIDELTASPLRRAARAAMTALSVETLLPSRSGVLAWPFPWSPFLCLFGFQEWTGSLAAFPPWGGVAVTLPDGSASHTSAAGAWQDEEATYGEIAAKTRRPGFEPQDQIANNWVLAVRDFGRRSGGGDLLATLETGELDKISPALVATWPEGADANFPARYAAALALFPPDEAPAPMPPAPAPQPGFPVPAMQPIEIMLGDRCTIQITAALDKNGAPVASIPADLLKPDDAAIGTASIASAALTIDTHALGGTVLRGADQTIPILVIPQVVTHLALDFAHAVYSPMATVAKAAIARLPMLAMIAALMVLGGPQIGDRAVPVRLHHSRIHSSSASDQTAKSYATPAFGSVAFCYDPSSTAFERCLRWTAALSRR